MTANGFSSEAANFVLERENRYMPLLATLANFSAKAIDPSFYDMKDEMLNRMESIAFEMGWRTFQSYDSTIAYPYIFYIDCGYAPQVSFHNACERETTWRGKWSQISVQDIAPKLVANLMKKDGFKGDIWDYSLIAVNLMQVANVIEADHLHKGICYNFSCESNELVVCVNGEQIEPNRVLLQSFMTRLAKMQKEAHTSESNEIGADELQEPESQISNATDVSPQQEGITEGCGKGGEQVDGNEAESKSENADGSASPSLDGIGQGGAECSIDGVGNDTTDITSINDIEKSDEKGISDLDSRDSEADATKPQAQGFDPAHNTTNQANGIENPLGTGKGDEGKGSTKGSNAPYKTFLEETLNGTVQQSKASDFAKKNTKDNRTHDEHSFRGKPRTNQRVADALLRVAGGFSLAKKQEGFQSWDAAKVVRALTVAPQLLLKAKFERPPHKIYFFVDTNCKNCGNEHCHWVNYSEFSVMLIQTAKQNDNIEVWSGSKCRPERDEKTAKQEIKKHHQFHTNLAEWIQKVQPEQGSTFVFWGECYNISLNAVALKKLTAPYKCLWLDSLRPTENNFYQNWTKRNKKAAQSEYEILKSVGFKIIKGCYTTDGFTKGLSTI